MSEDRKSAASSSLRRRRPNRNRARLRARGPRAGFAIGPILYLLALIGIGAGILFSGYSQILRSNIQITENMETQNDLSQAATVLAASSILGSSDNTYLCPPTGGNASANCALAAEKLETFAAAAASGGTAQLPTSYTSAGTTGTPPGFEVGVFAPGSGMKQLDPYGHYYVVCRWERQTSDGTNNSIQIMSAGPDGKLNTPCGNTTTNPLNDDNVVAWTAPYAVQHSAVWQTTNGGSGNETYFGNAGHQLQVDAMGDLTVPGSLAVTGTATFGNIGTFAGALSAPAFIGGTISGTTGTFSSTLDVTGNTLLGGTLGVTGNALLGGTLGVSSDTTLGGVLGVTGATTLSSTLGVDGATTLSSTLGVTGKTTLSGALAVTGTAIYGTTTGEQFIVNPLGSATANGGFIGNLSGSQSGGSISATGSSSTQALAVNGALTASAGMTVSGAANYTLDSAGNAVFEGNVSAANFNGNINVGSGGSTTITGLIPLANGGTGINATSNNNLLYQLGVLNSSSYLNMGLVQGGSVTDGMLQSTIGGSGATFYSVTVDAEGIVTGGSTTPFVTNYITDGNDSVTANGGQIGFTTSGVENDVINSQGWLGILTTTPVVPLTVGNPYAALNANEVAQFASGGATSTIAVRSASGGVTSAGILGVTTSGSASTVYLDTGATSGTSSLAFRVGGATEATIDGSGDIVASNFDGNLIGGTISATAEALSGTLTGTSAYFSGTVTANNISAATGYFTGTVTAASFSGSISGLISIPDGLVGTPGLFFTSETNTGLFRHGADEFGFTVGGVEAFELETAASAANYLTITPAALGSAPAIGVAGGDTNISLSLTPKGTGGVSVATGPLNIVSASSGLQLNGNNGISYPNSDTTSLAIGYQALHATTTVHNTAVGSVALLNDTTGSNNSAVGYEALYSNSTGNLNAGFGVGAGEYISTGSSNTAVGAATLSAGASGSPLTGSSNTGVGYEALNTAQATANQNTAMGALALENVTTGANNVALGYNTGAAVNVGSNNILIGASVNTPSGTDASNQLNIGGLLEGNMSSVALGLGKIPQTGTILDLSAGNGTGNSSMILPGASTVNRPGTGIEGMVRYNSDTKAAEAYLNGVWTTLLSDTSTSGGGTTGNLYLGTATTANPMIFNEPTSGFYTPGANTIAAEVGGATALTISSTGYVGIGTTAPNDRLDVAGSIGLLSTTTPIAATNGIYMPAANTLALTTSGATAMTITNTGSVGIGTTAPAVPLAVNGTGTVSGQLAVNGGPLTDTVTANDIGLSVAMKSADNEGIFISDNASENTGNGALIGGVLWGQSSFPNYNVLSTAIAVPSHSISNNSSQGFVNFSSVQSVAGNINRGINFASVNTNYGHANTGTSYAYVSQNYMQSTSSLANFIGFYSSGEMAVATPTVTNHYDFYADNFNYGSNGVITNRYGLYLNYTTTGITNAYGVYQVNSGVKNYFGGNVGIGTTAPTVPLQILGTNNPQFQINYNGTYYANFYVGSTGKTNIINNETNNTIDIGNDDFQLQHVSGSYAQISAYRKLMVVGDSAAGYQGAGDNLFEVYDNSNLRFSISQPGNINLPSGVWNNSGSVGIGTTSPTAGVALDLLSNTTTANSSLGLPGGSSGTTGRPTTGVAGMIRYNSSTPGVEAYYNSAWNSLLANTTSITSGVYLGTAAAANPSISGEPTSGFYTPGANTIAAEVGGTTALTISSTGYVGIGTTAPTTIFQVQASTPVVTIEDSNVSTNYGTIRVLANDGSTRKPLAIDATDIDFNAYSQNGSTSVPSINWGGAGQNTGLYYPATSTLGFVTARNEAMRITSTGSVGIGTTAPAYSLDVGVAATAGTVANFGNAGTGNANYIAFNEGAGFIGYNGSNLMLQSPAGSGITFKVNNNTVNSGTSVMYISTLGAVGIGTTSPTAGVALDLLSETTTANSSLGLPGGASGTTGRPTTGVAGMIRYNSSTPGVEAYYNSAWNSLLANTTSITSGVYLGTAAAANPSISGEPTSGFYTPGANTIAAEVGGTTALTISSTGYVGIGTTTPAQALSINGNLAGAAASTFVISSASGQNMQIQPGSNLLLRTGSVGIANGALGATNRLDVAGNVAIGSYAGNNSAPSNSLIVSGSVGIGTTAPGATLDVNGNIYMDGGGNSVQLSSNASNFEIVPNGNRQYYFSNSSVSQNGSFSIYGGSSPALNFGNSGDYISGGNFGVGTSSPAALLDVYGSAGYGAIDLGGQNGISVTTSDATGQSLAVGNGALGGLLAVTTGQETAVGYHALNAVTTGLANTALGAKAGASITTGSSNIVIGALAASTTLTTGGSNILIGNGLDGTSAGMSNTLNIGGLVQGNTSSITLGVGRMPQTGVILDLSAGNSSTNSSLILPGGYNGTADQGTTANRPGTGLDGMLRYNSNTPGLEAYVNGTWTTLLDDTSTGTSGNIYLGSSTTANPEVSGEPTTGFYTNGTNTIGAETAGSTALYITATQSVGIGTTGPGNKLDVVGNIRAFSSTANPIVSVLSQNAASYSPSFVMQAQRSSSSELQSGDTIGIFDFRNSDYNASARIAGFATQTQTSGAAGGQLRFYTTPNSTTTLTQQMVIDQSGNVGIGTTGPATALDVYANSNNIYVGDPGCGAGYVGIALVSTFSSCANYAIIGNSTDTFINRPSGGTIHFREANSSPDQVTIAHGGNVGIGTTSPGNKLTVQTATEYDGIYLSNGTHNIADIIGEAAGNDNGALQLLNAGTLNIYIPAAGNGYINNGANFGIGTTSPNAKLDVYSAAGFGAIDLGGVNGISVPAHDASAQSLAVGPGALGTLAAVTTAYDTAVGYQALAAVTTGVNNTALGRMAGASITTGTNNIVVGALAASTTLTTGGSNILIGNGLDGTSAGMSNTLNIGGLVQGNTSSIVLGVGQMPQAGAVLDLSAGNSSTNSSMILPGASTANRPGTGIAGMLRYNSDTSALEAYLGGVWTSILSDTTSAGGGTSGNIYLGTSTTANPMIFGEPTSGFYSPGANTIGAETAGHTALYITATQSIGIGTTAPYSILQTGPINDSTFIGTTALGSTSTMASLLFASKRDSVSAPDSQNVGGIYAESASGWISKLNFNLNNNWGIPTVNVMTLESNDGTIGVGIGTTAPATVFNLYGPYSPPSTSGSTATDTTFRINNTTGGASGGVLDMGQDGTVGGWIQSRSGGNYATDYPLLLNPNGGNVGIGTSAPDSTLSVNGGMAVGSYSGTTAASSGEIAASGPIYSGTTGGDWGDTWQMEARKDQNATTLFGVNNATSGASAANMIQMIGGTANSYETFALNDNAGSPYVTQAVGSGVQKAIWQMPAYYFETVGASTEMYIGGGNVGIGTVTPNATLDVHLPTLAGSDSNRTAVLYDDMYNAGANGQNLALTTLTTGGSFAGWNFSTDWGGRISFGAWPSSTYSTTPNEYLTIASSGNVGIGTTAPGAALDVTATGTGNGQASPGALAFRINDGLSRPAIAAYGNIDGTALADSTTSALAVRQVAGTGRSITTSGTIAVGGSGSSSYFLSNVGIGTTAPNNNLHVNTTAQGVGGIYLTSSAAGVEGTVTLMPNMGGGTSNSITQAADAGIIFSSSSGEGTGGFVIAPWAAATSGIRITSGGNVGIGTASPNGPLHIEGKNDTTTGSTSCGTESAACPASAASGYGVTLDTDYSTGQYRWRMEGIDRGAGIPLYMQYAAGTANSYVNVAKFGADQYDSNSFSVFGNANITGALTVGTFSLATLSLTGNYIYMAGGTGTVNSTGGPFIYADGTNWVLHTGAGNGSVYFQNGSGTAEAAISVNGNSYFDGGSVGIGTTAPASRLQVYGSDGAEQLTVNGATNLLRVTPQSTNMTVESTNLAQGAYAPLFLDGSTVMLGNSNTVYMTLTGGNVGIGTSAPGYKLEVDGTTGFDNYVTLNRNRLYIAGPGDTNHMLGNGIDTIGGTSDGESFVYASFFNLKSDTGNEAITAANNGYVGIGTTTPNAPLSVNGSLLAGTGGNILNGASVQQIHVGGASSAPSMVAVTDAGIRTMYMTAGNSYNTLATDGGDISFRVGGSWSSSSPDTAGTEVMHLTSGGYVGIGTTAPAALLSMNGDNIEFSQGRGSADPTAYARYGYTSGYLQYIANNATWNGTQWNYVNAGGYGGLASLQTQSSGVFNFETASNAANPVAWNSRLFIANAGNVGIGTTGPENVLTVQSGGIGIHGASSNPTGNPGLYLGFTGGVGSVNSINNGTAWEKLTIDASPLQINFSSGGAVNIGTTTATTTLNVGGSEYATGNIISNSGCIAESAGGGYTCDGSYGLYVNGAGNITGNLTVGGSFNPASITTGTLYLTNGNTYLQQWGGFNVYNSTPTLLATNYVINAPVTNSGFQVQNQAPYNLNAVAGDYSMPYGYAINDTREGEHAGFLGVPQNSAGNNMNMVFYVGNDGANQFQFVPYSWDGTYNHLGTPVMVVQPWANNGGVVGIETTSPAYTLDVNGNIRISSTNYLYLNSTATLGWDGSEARFATPVYFNAGGTALWAQAQAHFRGGINNDTGGYLELDGGTTSDTYVNGSLGIGISSPSYALDVRGTGNPTANIGSNSNCCSASTATLGISEATSSNSRLPWIQFHAAGFQEAFLRLQKTDRTFEIGDNQSVGTALALMNAAATGRNVYISPVGSSYFNGGNVGIGTTSPSYLLDVNGAARISTQLEISNAGGWPLLGFDSIYNGNGGGGFTNTAAGYPGMIETMQDNGRLAFLTNGSSQTAGASFSMTERMDIMQNGNVGIGTTGPGEKLDVWVGTSAGDNSIRVKGYQPSFQVYNNANTANWYFGNNDANSNALYIGRGYGPNQGIAPDIFVSQSSQVGIETTSITTTLNVGGSEYATGNIISNSGCIAETAGGGYTCDGSYGLYVNGAGNITGNLTVGGSLNPASITTGTLTVTGATTLENSLNQYGGFAYLGSVNTTGYPTSNSPSGTPGLAVSWNFSSGGGETDLWNTYTGAGTGSTAFSFKQLTGASTRTDIMTMYGNGYVGIGATPAQLLTVGPASNAANSFYNVGANTMAVNSSFYSYGLICAGNASGACTSSGGVVIQGSGSNIYGSTYITGGGNTYFNGGNVGIGTTSPGGLLQVHNTANSGDGLVISPERDGDNTISIQSYIDTTAGGGLAGAGTYAGGCCDDLALNPEWGQVSVGGAGNYGNKFNVIGTSYFSSSVGIGTASPSYTLQVNGTAYATELQTSDNIWVGYMGTWMSNWVNQVVTAGSSPNFYNPWIGYMGTNLSNWVNQAVLTTSSVTFGSVVASGNISATGGQMSSAGTTAGYETYDRYAPDAGNYSYFYRYGNVTRLYDNSAGDVISYSSGGYVGIGNTGATARLSVGTTALGGGSASTTFNTSAGGLGTAVNSDLSIGSIGFTSSNQTSLGIHAYRASAGSDWTTTSILLGMDVDSSTRVNASYLSFSHNGNIGIHSVTPDHTLAVAGDIGVSGIYYAAGHAGQTVATTCGQNFQSGIYIGTNDTGCGGGGGGGGGSGGGYDIAEYYSTQGVAPQRGDIVAFTGETSSHAQPITNPAPGEKAKSTYDMTTARVALATDVKRGMVFGVVPTAPGVILGGKDGKKDMGPNAQMVALAGHVPVRMTFDGGAIAIGDPITVSTSTPGAGMKATGSGRIVGWALEPFTKANPSKTGMIEVFIAPQDWTSSEDIQTLKADNDDLHRQLTALQASVSKLNLPVRGAAPASAKDAAVLDKISWKVPGSAKTDSATPSAADTIAPSGTLAIYALAGFGGLMLIGFAGLGGFVVATRREMRRMRKAMKE